MTNKSHSLDLQSATNIGKMVSSSLKKGPAPKGRQFATKAKPVKNKVQKVDKAAEPVSTTTESPKPAPKKTAAKREPRWSQPSLPGMTSAKIKAMNDKA